MKIKTRFAPSPTGDLHIGNVRTALYSWLFARKTGGKFLLRIEDSNMRYSTSSAVATIISGLKWLNLDWDEGPYFQTNRLKRYNSIINYMIDNGIAYKCYCSPERLELLRTTQMKDGKKPKYDGYCRVKRDIEIQNSLRVPYVVRFCNPQEGTTKFYDKIRGMIVFDNKELDDLIICRADGSPTYNLCVVVDDMDMNITHVIRGEEHISNTPRQINILKALKASIPIYAHVSMILNDDRKKLSKRHQTLGILQYRNNGFLPEAILNYLVRLGWSHGNQEIFSVDEMKEYFNFDQINKSASIFNLKKLLWYNHYYINYLPIDYVVSCVSWYMNEQGINIQNEPKLIDLVKLFVKRSHTLQDIADNVYYFYKDFDFLQEKVLHGYLNINTVKILQVIKEELNNIIFWTPEFIQSVFINTMNKLDINMKQIGFILRIVLIGIDRSPSLSSVVYIMGKLRVSERIDRALYVFTLS